MRSLTKELQHSLDLASATSGDKVVTAQVSEAVDLTFVLVLMYRVAVWFFIARLLNLFLFFFRKMRMNRPHLRVEDKLQALSVLVPTLGEN